MKIKAAMWILLIGFAIIMGIMGSSSACNPVFQK